MSERRRVGAKIDRAMLEQSRFLQHCIEHEITVTVFMASGATLMGIPRDFDGKCILIGYRNPEKEPKLIYTNFVTLIRADEVLSLRDEYHGEETALRKLRKRARRSSPIQIQPAI